MPNGVDESESRTASVGRRVPAPATASAPSTSTSSLHSTSSSPRSTSTKRRRRGKKASSDVRDFVPMGANFSKLSELQQSSPSNPTNPTNPTTSTADPTAHEGDQSANLPSSVPDLGNNRLVTGFKPPSTFVPARQMKSSRSYSHASTASSAGGSKEDAIEISSDEEMEDSEGGMIVNLNNGVPDLTIDSTSEDEGMITSSDDEDEPQIQRDLATTADTTTSADSTSSRIRLLDLSPKELEEQIKYALYHMDRTQVDPNRLVTCLSCMQPGHLSSQCPGNKCKHCNEGNAHPTKLCPVNQRCTKCRERGHSSRDCTSDLRVTTTPCDICGILSHVEQDCPQRHFPQPMIEVPVKLWISCCICASKSHLVGDCPDAPKDTAIGRWSLKSLDPGHITNLSLESGTRKLEKEAESRGMRPAGLQIKGRASNHQAGISRSAPVSDDEQDSFFQPRVTRSGRPAIPRVRLGDYERRRPDPPMWSTSDRYDRFDAPSFDSRSQNRGGSTWYATDSFGRRRSRSPRPETWRPGSRRSPSPRRFDGHPQPDRSYRAPPPSDHWRPPENSLPPRPPASKNNSGTGMPAPSRPVQLPTRKGSNLSLPAKPTAQPADSGKKKAKKGKGGSSQA